MKHSAPRPWTGSPYRRRRTLWSLALLTLGSIYYFSVYGAPSFLSLPASLKDVGLGFSPASSRAGRLALAKQAAYAGEGAYAAVRELDALLHFLTAHPARKLDEDGGSIRVAGMGSVVVDPTQPVDLRVYEPEGDFRWEEYAADVRKQYPLVVISKTTCPYSKAAKELLDSYDISPKPKVIEINVRSDSPHIQEILARLTGRKTVPNILLKGETIGGSDDIHKLHSEHKLKALLEDSGLSVKGDAAKS